MSDASANVTRSEAPSAGQKSLMAVLAKIEARLARTEDKLDKLADLMGKSATLVGGKTSTKKSKKLAAAHHPTYPKLTPSSLSGKWSCLTGMYRFYPKKLDTVLGRKYAGALSDASSHDEIAKIKQTYEAKGAKWEYRVAQATIKILKNNLKALGDGSYKELENIIEDFRKSLESNINNNTVDRLSPEQSMSPQEVAAGGCSAQPESQS